MTIWVCARACTRMDLHACVCACVCVSVCLCACLCVFGGFSCGKITDSNPSNSVYPKQGTKIYERDKHCKINRLIYLGADLMSYDAACAVLSYFCLVNTASPLL